MKSPRLTAPLVLGCALAWACSKEPDERALGSVPLAASGVELEIRAKLVPSSTAVIRQTSSTDDEQRPNERRWFLKLELGAPGGAELPRLQRVGEPSPALLSEGWKASHELLDALELERCEHPSGELSTLRVRDPGGRYDSGWRHVYARGELVLEAGGSSELEDCAQAQAQAPSLDELLKAR